MDQATFRCVAASNLPRFLSIQNFIEPGVLDYQHALRRTLQTTSDACIPLGLSNRSVARGFCPCIPLVLSNRGVARGCCPVFGSFCPVFCPFCPSFVHGRFTARTTQPTSAIGHEKGDWPLVTSPARFLLLALLWLRRRHVAGAAGLQGPVADVELVPESAPACRPRMPAMDLWRQLVQP